MKSALKWALAHTPYRVVRRQAHNRFQAVEASLLAAADRGFRPTIIIDGGANVGEFARAALQIFPEAKVHTIEPQPGCVAALNLLAAEIGKRLVFHPVALCEPADAGSSLTLASDASFTSTGAHVVVGDYKPEFKTDVPCVTLDSLLAGQLTRGDRILLKLDLQGYELHALKGAIETLTAVEMVLTEVSFFRQAYEPPIESLVTFLSDQGFELYDIASISGRARDQRAKQGDFIFVRRGTQLTVDARWE